MAEEEGNRLRSVGGFGGKAPLWECFMCRRFRAPGRGGGSRTDALTFISAVRNDAVLCSLRRKVSIWMQVTPSAEERVNAHTSKPSKILKGSRNVRLQVPTRSGNISPPPSQFKCYKWLHRKLTHYNFINKIIL